MTKTNPEPRQRKRLKTCAACDFLIHRGSASKILTYYCLKSNTSRSTHLLACQLFKLRLAHQVRPIQKVIKKGPLL